MVESNVENGTGRNGNSYPGLSRLLDGLKSLNKSGMERAEPCGVGLISPAQKMNIMSV
jgi:hypothetical protein